MTPGVTVPFALTGTCLFTKTRSVEFDQRGNCTVAGFWSDKLWPPGPSHCGKPIKSALSSLITRTMFHPEPKGRVCRCMFIHCHLSNSLHLYRLSLRTCLTVIYVPVGLSVPSVLCKTRRQASVMQLWLLRSCLCFMMDFKSSSLWFG